MKRLLLFAGAAFFVISCNNKDEKMDAKSSDSTKMADSKMTGAKEEKLDMPYTLDSAYQDWQPGDKQHAVTVMKGLKAFETGDMDGCVAAFGDSVDLRFDYYHSKLSHDSLKNFFTQQRAEYTSMKIKMYDWESVISSDKKDQWVTLWYKQIWTDKKGKIDSMSMVDDAKIVNGKIVVLDEKGQHYPAVKK